MSETINVLGAQVKVESIEPAIKSLIALIKAERLAFEALIPLAEGYLDFMEMEGLVPEDLLRSTRQYIALTKLKVKVRTDQLFDPSDLDEVEPIDLWGPR